MAINIDSDSLTNTREPTGICEHGDHPAPKGRRFCSYECEACEHGTFGRFGCENICGLADQHKRSATNNEGEST